MAIAATLEGVIGANVDIYDFVSGAPQRERTSTIRNVAKYVFDNKVLKKLAGNRQHDVIQARISKILESGDVREALKIVETYYDLKQGGFKLDRSDFRNLATLILEKDLKTSDGSCVDFGNDQFNFCWRGDSQFISDLVRLGDKSLINSYADAMKRIDVLDVAFDLYSKTGNDKGVLSVIMSYYGAYSFPNVARLLRKCGKGLAKTAIDEMARREILNEYSGGSFKQVVDTAIDIGYIRPIEDIADSLAEKSRTIADPDNAKKAINIYRQLMFTDLGKSVKKKLVGMAREALEKGNIDDFKLAYEGLDYGSISRKEFIGIADKIVTERLKGKGSSVVDENVEHVYSMGDIFGGDLADRVAGIATSVGRHGFAAQTYLGRREYQKAFDSVMRIAGTGDLKEAFSLLQEITKKHEDELRPSRIETDKPEFYQTIASSVLSLYLINPKFDPEVMKKIVNEKICGMPIKDLSVKSGKGKLVVDIDFGNQKVVYEQQNVPGEKRNDVRLFRQKGLFSKDSALKFYEDKQNAEDEAYWIGVLEGKLPVQRVISSERFGDLRFNQIESCNGKPLEKADYNTLKKAIDLSFKLYDAVSKGTHAKHMTKDFVRERVSAFGVDADWIYNTLRKNEAGIVHNDYAPRNFMVGEKLIPIDHECYVFGHPVGMAVSMIKTHDNQITKEQAEELISYARSKHPVSDEYVKAATILWDCRQARRAEKGNEIYNWHIKDMNEVMRK